MLQSSGSQTDSKLWYFLYKFHHPFEWWETTQIIAKWIAKIIAKWIVDHLQNLAA
jgi:hypothetical protein